MYIFKYMNKYTATLILNTRLFYYKHITSSNEKLRFFLKSKQINN